MSLVSRYGPASAPVEVSDVEPVVAVEGSESGPDAVRKMFAGLGWSTTVPDADEMTACAESPDAILETADEVDAVELERVRARPAVVDVDEAPANAVTGAQYGGRNIARLQEAQLIGGYGPGGWAGFQQWLTVGRVVRKGEHGTACVTVIGTRATSSADSASSNGPEIEGSRKGKGRGVRGFRVFHFDQTTELKGGK